MPNAEHRTPNAERRTRTRMPNPIAEPEPDRRTRTRSPNPNPIAEPEPDRRTRTRSPNPNPNPEWRYRLVQLTSRRLLPPRLGRPAPVRARPRAERHCV